MPVLGLLMLGLALIMGVTMFVQMKMNLRRPILRRR